jgi:hypothetical protein
MFDLDVVKINKYKEEANNVTLHMRMNDFFTFFIRGRRKQNDKVKNVA